MYIKTENGEIIEVNITRLHVCDSGMRGREENFYKRNGRPDVKPVAGTSSWQLFWIPLGGVEEICIATFDTVKAANQAFKSIKWTRSNEAWDATEYKKEISSKVR